MVLRVTCKRLLKSTARISILAVYYQFDAYGGEFLTGSCGSGSVILIRGS